MTHWHGANAISVALLWRETPSFGTSWDFGVNDRRFFVVTRAISVAKMRP